MTGVALMLFIHTSAPALNPAGHVPLQTLKDSRQYQNGKFQGPGQAFDMSVAKLAATTWDFLFTKNNRTPDTQLPHTPVELTYFNNTDEKQLNVTWLGHSSLMVNIDGYKILMDPVFQKRVSLFGPTRFNGDVPLDIAQLPLLDAVIISHDHYDHLNKYTLQHIHGRTKVFIVPLKVGERLVKWGVPREKIVALDWWDEFHLDARLKIAATPAQHFSGRGLTDRNKTLWASWVVSGPTHNIFFSGDSGYFEGFKQIGRKYGPFDMTFLECGAYNTAWRPVHMFPEETVQAHLDLKGALLHPIHWATFNLALHPWYEPMERLTAAAEKAGIKTVTPVVGATTVSGEPLTTSKWWHLAMPKAPA
jgi:L-ascorbate metabolism protein UlaG (beta-lactamase superfamily)